MADAPAPASRTPPASSSSPASSAALSEGASPAAAPAATKPQPCAQTPKLPTTPAAAAVAAAAAAASPATTTPALTPASTPATTPASAVTRPAGAPQTPGTAKGKGGRKAANPHLSDDERRRERVLKNRESAMKSLQKKKRYTEGLETRAAVLSARNAELKAKIRRLLDRIPATTAAHEYLASIPPLPEDLLPALPVTLQQAVLESAQKQAAGAVVNGAAAAALQRQNPLQSLMLPQQQQSPAAVGFVAASPVVGHPQLHHAASAVLQTQPQGAVHSLPHSFAQTHSPHHLSTAPQPHHGFAQPPCQGDIAMQNNGTPASFVTMGTHASLAGLDLGVPSQVPVAPGPTSQFSGHVGAVSEIANPASSALHGALSKVGTTTAISADPLLAGLPGDSSDLLLPLIGQPGLGQAGSGPLQPASGF